MQPARRFNPASSPTFATLLCSSQRGSTDSMPPRPSSFSISCFTAGGLLTLSRTLVVRIKHTCLPVLRKTGCCFSSQYGGFSPFVLRLARSVSAPSDVRRLPCVHVLLGVCVELQPFVACAGLQLRASTRLFKRLSCHVTPTLHRSHHTALAAI